MNVSEGATGGKGTVRGFTLIELMVTIAVLAIIISLGIPMYGQFTQGAGLSSRTSELVSSIHLARSEAVTRRAPIRMEAIDGDWTLGWEIYDDSLATPMLRQTDLRSSDVNYDIAEVGNLTVVTFDGQGRVSDLARFTICLRGAGNTNGRLLTLSRFGRVETVNIVGSGVDCP